jgi:hypothetical protein
MHYEPYDASLRSISFPDMPYLYEHYIGLTCTNAGCRWDRDGRAPSAIVLDKIDDLSTGRAFVTKSGISISQSDRSMVCSIKPLVYVHNDIGFFITYFFDYFPDDASPSSICGPDGLLEYHTDDRVGEASDCWLGAVCELHTDWVCRWLSGATFTADYYEVYDAASTVLHCYQSFMNAIHCTTERTMRRFACYYRL